MKRMRRRLVRYLSKSVHTFLDRQGPGISGDVEDVDRQARRQVKVTKEHNEEVRRLLRLMGIPYHDVRVCLSPALDFWLKLLVQIGAFRSRSSMR